ncbi:DUF3833 domain-containing protein [Alteromonas sediminis]|uniref:DUF3833 domain-containing protein n=1 Tax=Alteromonas sediminis TaxID=2259342 RepID=A0A3N5YE46_9ALTE|nr:DUF3833 domain-containing protein [Alteromonas sediminis]RPJ67895.1 DUF3833 domain-containing protein [Alteromonas sediminis]
MGFIRRSVLLLAAWTLLSGCSLSIDGEQYQSLSPKLDIRTFFDGQVKAWGIVQNRSGEVVQRFVVDIDGTREGNTLTLDETFEYFMGDGPEKRIWVITYNEDGSFTGEAGDIMGKASGRSYGNAFNFQYEMDLPVGDTSYEVAFNDWFWAFDQETLMNRAYIQKFGIVMAEVTIFMQRQEKSVL